MNLIEFDAVLPADDWHPSARLREPFHDVGQFHPASDPFDVHTDAGRVDQFGPDFRYVHARRDCTICRWSKIFFRSSLPKQLIVKVNIIRRWRHRYWANDGNSCCHVKCWKPTSSCRLWPAANPFTSNGHKLAIISRISSSPVQSLSLCRCACLFIKFLVGNLFRCALYSMDDVPNFMHDRSTWYFYFWDEPVNLYLMKKIYAHHQCFVS